MAATNAGLFRKRLSLGSGGKAPPSALRAAAPSEACTLLDISNGPVAAAPALSGAIACQQRAAGQRAAAAGAAAAAAEPSAGSSDGWDDDDAAPSWDLLGDLGFAHAPQAAQQAPVDVRIASGQAPSPLQPAAASAPPLRAGLQQQWASPAVAAQKPLATGGAAPPSGRPSGAWRSAGGSTSRRRRRMRSVFAGEDEEAGGGNHSADEVQAADGGTDDGEELHSAPPRATWRAQPGGQREAAAPAHPLRLGDCSSGAMFTPTPPAAAPLPQLDQHLQQAAQEKGDAARSGQRPAAGGHLSLQRCSPAGPPDANRRDAAGGAAGADALPAAAARHKGNPFARAGAAAEGSRITLASSVGTGARSAAATAAAAAADGLTARLGGLPASAAAEPPRARPWAQQRAFKPPRADPRQRQQQEPERTARAVAALGSSSSDDDFEEPVPATRARRRRSAGGQLAASGWSSQAPQEARQLGAGLQQRQACAPVKREPEVVSLLGSCGDGDACAAAPPAATESWQQPQQPQQQGEAFGGWGHGAPSGPQPDPQRPDAALQQRQQWPAPDAAPLSGGGQLFWQAAEDEEGWEGEGDWGWQQQQQQQRGWQASDGITSHAPQPHCHPTQPLPSTAGGRRADWQAAGGGGEPWWARFPDFVPVAALLGGRDPRDGCQVFIDYQQQFSGVSGGGATAASKRAADSTFAPAVGGGRSHKRGASGGKRAAKDDDGSMRSCWANEGGKNVYYDARGRKLWGQRGYMAAKREKGEPAGAAGGSGRKRSGGGGRKRSGGSRKRSKR